MDRGHQWTCYSGTTAFLAVTNTLLDLLRGGLLIKAGHLLAGVAVFAIVGLSGAASWVALSIERCCGSRIHADSPLPLSKVVRLSFDWWIHATHPYFQAGPQLVFLLNLMWRGIHLEPLRILGADSHLGTWYWFEGIIFIASALLHLATLVTTHMHDNREKGPQASKLASALSSVTSGILLRSYLFSMLLAIKPITAVTSLAVAYTVNVVLMKYLNREGWSCFLDGYASLMTPTGYARVLGTARRYLSRQPWETVTDVERVKINQERLVRNYKISHAKFGTLSLMLMVAYALNVEFYLFKAFTVSIFSSSGGIAPELENRKFLYVTPAAIWVINTIATSLHLRQMKTARDAARTWHTITPRKRQVTKNPASTTSTPSGGAIGKLPSAVRLKSLLSVSPKKSKETTPPIIRPSAPPPEPLPPSAPVTSTPHRLFQRDDQSNVVPTITTPSRGNRTVLGTYKYHHSDDCVTCDMLTEGPTFQSTMTGKQYKFLPAVSCNERSVIYLVTCANPSCMKQYVGKTEQELKQRHYGHRREIETKSSLLGKHFADSCGYTSFRIQIIDQIHEPDSHKRRKDLLRREGYWQHELSTFVPMGLNTRDESGDHSKSQ